MELRIAHLYPDLLNLYGDRGNLIAIRRRCEWRGITCTIMGVSLDHTFSADQHDLVFLGGGQDYEQTLLYHDLVEKKGPAIRSAVEAGMVFLCICGGYQLMGRYYEKQDGERIEGIDALDLWTVAKKSRLIGDTVYKSSFLASQGRDPVLVGFENHSGRTWLGPSVQPMATVVRGHGNNGKDHTEGAIYKNTYCTYSHGSFLPKNPNMTDYLIEIALKRRYKDILSLKELDNTFENNARNSFLSCK